MVVAEDHIKRSIGDVFNKVFRRKDNTLAIAEGNSVYGISDMDIAGATRYYGYLASDGQWYIMREDTASWQYRYSKGTANYATNWTGRVGLTYDYYNVVFPSI